MEWSKFYDFRNSDIIRFNCSRKRLVTQLGVAIGSISIYLLWSFQVQNSLWQASVQDRFALLVSRISRRLRSESRGPSDYLTDSNFIDIAIEVIVNPTGRIDGGTNLKLAR